MKALNEINLPDDRKYTDEHIWAKKDGDTFLVGVSDFAQDQLGEIVYIDLPSVNDSFTQSSEFGEIESVKSVNKLFMPFNGLVVAVNSNLEDSPTLVNTESYENWIVRIKADNIEDYNSMLDVSAYRAILEK